jgi:ferredoxin
VLEAGLAAGLPMPYSCAMGGCGACKIRLERGEVVMREPNCLGAREREAGYVLACVSNPAGPCRLRVDEESS